MDHQELTLPERIGDNLESNTIEIPLPENLAQEEEHTEEAGQEEMPEAPLSYTQATDPEPQSAASAEGAMEVAQRVFDPNGARPFIVHLHHSSGPRQRWMPASYPKSACWRYVWEI